MNEGLALDNLGWLHALWGVLLLTLLALLALRWRITGLRALADARLLPRLMAERGHGRFVLRAALLLAAMVLLIAALVGPRWGQREERLRRRGVDIMVVLDVSRSMLARDIAPDRLTRAKLAVRDDLLPALGGDRVGLVLFAGGAALACPLTHDYGFFRLALDDASPNSISRGGTAIGDAIRAAAAAFDDKLETDRMILLITDGEDQESYPVEAAATAWKDKKIPVVAIALGDERDGARIPTVADGGERYLTYKGETVWSKANFDQLRSVAAASGLNRFVPVGTRNFDLGQIYRESILPHVANRQREELERVRQPARFDLFAMAALGLLVMHALIREGRTPTLT